MRAELSRGEPRPEPGLLQRKCSCDGASSATGECEECRNKLQRFAIGPAPEIPSSVAETLRSPGSPLDSAARSFFEPRFGHNFSQVRVHAGSRAAESARDVNAAAYTVGRNIVFASQQYKPETPEGRKLLAHELTHVVQQRAMPSLGTSEPLKVDHPDSLLEREAKAAESSVLSAQASPVLRTAQPMVSRADPVAVSRTLNLRGMVGSGVQFAPTNLTDTQVGPVLVQGGLMSERANRLNVIIGPNLTLRILAQEILPLWTTATPFTPPGAAAPLPLAPITADDLARALLVYNRYYLPVPSMTEWKAGLRFPLPVRVDENTGMGTLHPGSIQDLAALFDPAWEPFLDSGAVATAAPPAATLQADVTAFLARETSPLARGIHLGARAITNAVALLPFLRETFRQLGADTFEVALTMMDFLVNRQIDILAAQQDGKDILGELRSALGGVPVNPTTQLQERVTRATNMLNRVTGVTAQATPETFVNPCHPIRPLIWSDFAGTPSGSFAALTSWDFPEVTTGGITRLRAVFDSASSWVRPRSANPNDPALNGCNAIVRDCERRVSPASTYFRTAPVPNNCPSGILMNSSVVATTFADCGGILAAECARVEPLESERLLRHEQLHLDIACVLAGKANAALAARRSLGTVKSALQTRSNQQTSAYDTQTHHGCLAVEQANWERDVSNGLPGVSVP